ncbi:S-adenosyl-L-methionine-dependent methyltransferase [Apiospora saccharicola]
MHEAPVSVTAAELDRYANMLWSFIGGTTTTHDNDGRRARVVGRGELGSGGRGHQAGVAGDGGVSGGSRGGARLMFVALVAVARK